MTTIICIISTWLFFGILSAGFLNNYYREMLPWFYMRLSGSVVLLWMLIGPIGFCIHLLNIKFDNLSNSYLPERKFWHYGWSLYGKRKKPSKESINQ